MKISGVIVMSIITVFGDRKETSIAEIQWMRGIVVGDDIIEVAVVIVCYGQSFGFIQDWD